MAYNITVFGTAPTKGKVALSPFGDKTFEFMDLDVPNLNSVMRQISQNFVLNLPLELKSTLRARRTKSEIYPYLRQHLDYFILDVDDIKSPEAMRKVLDYFKGYRVLICESRSFNGIDNFNLKGVVECDFNLSQLCTALDQMFFDLADFGTVDRSVCRCPTFNAPIGKYNVVLDTTDNEQAKLMRFSDLDISNVSWKTPTEMVHLKFTDGDFTNAKTVSDLCLTAFHQQGFKAVGVNQSGGIRFSHPSEVKSPGGYIWYESYPYLMRHFNSTRNINIKEFIQSLPEYKELKETDTEFADTFYAEKDYGYVTTVSERYLTVTPTIRGMIQDFIDGRDGLFAIHSAMGTGKSTIIKEIINEAKANDQSVLLVTPRVSVALDFKEKYDLKLYNKDQYELGDSLICQYDSLFHYNIRCFDIVVFDEFCSTVFHSRTGINSADMQLFAMFMACLQKKVVIADAFLSGFDALIRKPKESTYIIRNTYRDPTKLVFYANVNTFKDKICDLAQVSKIAISTTSMLFGKACAMYLKDQGCRVTTLFGDTPDEIKDKIYTWLGQPDDDHFDVLVYSPTVTVGISINVDIPYHFHYDCGRSCDVVSSLQMIKRVRNSKEIHLFIQNAGQRVLTTPDQIMKDWLNSMDSSDSIASWLFTCNDYGEIEVSKRGKFVADIDAIINKLHRKYRYSFLGLLRFQFSEIPLYVTNIHQVNRFKKYETVNDENKKRSLSLAFDQFLEMNDIEQLTIKSNDAMDRVIQVNSRLKPCERDIKRKIFELVTADQNFQRKCVYYQYAKGYKSGALTPPMMNQIIASAIARNDSDLYMFLKDLMEIKDIRESYKSNKLPGVLSSLTSKIGYKIRSNGDGTNSYAIPEEIAMYSKFFIQPW